MKTYATWEVIKSLTEKTQQKLKLVNGCKRLDYLGSIASNYVGFLLVKNTNSVIIDLNSINGIFLSGVWELVQEPVSIEVAAKAFMNGKNVRCEYPDFTNKMHIIIETFTQNDVVGSMKIDAADITFYMMIEGKWFIEEDNINE